MSQTASRSRTVFRACVVNAVRGGEAVMGQLIKVTQGGLAGQEATVRNIQERNLVSDGLRLLNQHESALVKGYPMALLEIFAEGPASVGGRVADDTGMDFGELSLMDEHEIQAQVELSRAQQSALHATDAVLAELNTLVSSAQGLRSVQPERNPLRPESYIRALQKVVGETGVSSEVRQLWMQHMREELAQQLVAEYKRAAQSLREHGIEPVGYAVLGTPSAGARGGNPVAAGGGGSTGYGGGYGTGYGSGYGGPGADYGTGYGRPSVPSTGWSGDHSVSGLPPSAEEALLTVGILRQMLAGGDPFDPRSYGAAPPQQVAPPASGWADPRGGRASGQASLSSRYGPAAAAEAIEDMAQLERLVGRLSGSQAPPLSGWAGTGAAPVFYGTIPMGMASASPAVAVEVVERMVANIAQDSRLLPAVQRAVKAMEPALKQLVRHDPLFFTDGQHPARRLLDECTQRSLAFAAENDPGFSRFIRLVNDAIGHLVAATDIRTGEPFETVLKALHAAWDAQERKVKAQQQAQESALLQTEQREMLAERIAADIRKLPDLGQVPPDVLDFAAGPWAEVVALAQVSQGPDGNEDDPGGYLALVPVLLWSAQPELTRQEPERLSAAIPGLLAKLRKGLKTIQHPAVQTSVFLQRLVALHQQAFEKPAPSASPSAATGVDDSTAAVAEGSEGVAEVQAPAADAVADPADDGSLANAPPPAVPDVDPYADFVIGAWVELVTNGRTMRTQLTWCSPHGTLFLFTAPDASTQSMTRRMRDKLVKDGLLRVVPAQPVTARALDAVATGNKTGKAR